MAAPCGESRMSGRCEALLVHDQAANNKFIGTVQISMAGPKQQPSILLSAL